MIPEHFRTLLLMLLIAASEGLYVLLLRLDAVNGARPVAAFLAILGAEFALCFAAYWLLRNQPVGRLALVITVGGAVLFRATLLPAGLPPDQPLSEKLAGMTADWRGNAVTYERFQLFDDDVWRYLWDGHLAATGRNPYSSAPADSDESEPYWETIRDNVGYPKVRTIYPPLAEIVFRFAHALAPGSVLAMKIVVVGFDLLAYGLVILTLAATPERSARSILYGWNPLVIKVFAGSGHIDSVLVAALAATCYFLARKRPASASVSLGLAIAAKLAPVVLLPFLARRVGVKRVILAAAIPIACYLPFVGAGRHLLDGLLAFGAAWQFNSGAFRLFAWLLPDLLARITCAVLIAIALYLLYRRDNADPHTFARVATIALGAILIFSPVVPPWYATWLLPLGVLAANRAAIFFSVSVCLAFLVMMRGVEWPWVSALEYGSVALMIWWSRRSGIEAPA